MDFITLGSLHIQLSWWPQQPCTFLSLSFSLSLYLLLFVKRYCVFHTWSHDWSRWLLLVACVYFCVLVYVYAWVIQLAHLNKIKNNSHNHCDTVWTEQHTSIVFLSCCVLSTKSTSIWCYRNRCFFLTSIFCAKSYKTHTLQLFSIFSDMCKWQ